MSKDQLRVPDYLEIEDTMIVSARHRDVVMKLVMTTVVILITSARQPELLIVPRFWAEEGSRYFSYAYNHSWLDNLFFPQYGYNTLYNSIATSLATAAPLNYAPLVTTWLAFITQIAVSAAVIWWNIPVIDSLWKKFTIALLVQTLAYSRIWLTTIGVQYWLCILSFLILLYDYRGNDKKMLILHNCQLILNGLTGILSCLLIPAFFFKYIKTRSRQILHQTIILTSCMAIQLGVYLYAYLNKSEDLSVRFINSSFAYIMSKIIKFEFSVPFFGLELYETDAFNNAETIFRTTISHVVGPAIISSEYGLLEIVLGILIICFLAVLAVKIIRRLETQLILISLASVTMISTYFSINRSGGPRYTFAPSIMILVLVISAINDQTIHSLIRYFATILVVLSVVVSLIQYRRVMAFAYNPAWPLWQFEVYKWQCDPGYQPKIWPPGWQMQL